MEFPVGLCLAALLLMSGVAKAQTTSSPLIVESTTVETSSPLIVESTTVENSCQALQCTQSEECSTINGAYGCGCQSRPNSDSFDAIQSCASSTSDISLSRCQLFEAGLNITSLHLNDPSCTGSIQNGRVFFHFDNDQNVCGTTLRSNGTHFLYENSIQKGSGLEGLISRHSWVNINFTCVYPLIQSISMPMSIQASEGVVFKEFLNQGSYQIRMVPYPNASFIAPYSGDVTVDMNQQIYVAVEVDGVDGQQISTVLDHCWATPSADMDNTIRWDLIINDCPNLRDGTVQVLQNGISTSARFSFKMFTFTSYSNRVYLHCEVHLCLKNLGSCSQSCNPMTRRRRRSLNYLEPAAVTMAF